MVWVRVGGQEPKLKKWITLENYKDRILKAVENKQQDFPEILLAYLSTAFGVPVKWIQFANWELLVKAFYVYQSKSPKIQLPITTPSDEHHKDSPWDYDHRTWHLYSHMLAKAYGWSLEYISCLNVEEALAKIEEILVDEQLEKEFYYGLSEAAYSYDKNTKTSKFVPLPRPNWMQEKPKEIKKIPIPVSMLPVGVVYQDALPEEYLPKEYET